MSRPSKRPHNQGKPENPLDSKQIGRLAFRRVGHAYSAYYALPDTMHEAIELGSIAFAFIDGKPERQKVFVDLMRDCLGDLMQAKFGVRPHQDKDPTPAPFWETTGEPPPGSR